MVLMKKRGFFAVLLCLLLLSNMATYFYTRFLFLSPAAEVVGEQRSGERLLGEVHDILKKRYYQLPDEEDLFHGAVKGMLDSLGDPYTAYLQPESLQDMLAETTGMFSGIGVEIAEDEGEILILRVLDHTPAFHAGLYQGDRILEVDGKGMAGMALDEVARLLRGPGGTTVNIMLRRPGESELLSAKLTREQIERDTVFSNRLDGKLAYIKITCFDQNTGVDFRNAVNLLEKGGLEGLVVDLRDNPGGLFDEAIEVGKFIVPAGEITRMVDREGKVLDRYFSRADPRNYPLVVLVNQYTASAAEIIAGALQDSKSAVLVGKPTYGKASVQSLQSLSDGGALRYTIARYLTPGGRDLHRDGLQPDFEISLPDGYYLKNMPVPRGLAPGDTGEKVLILQRMLRCLGYSPEITGVYDEMLLNALHSFQKQNGLPPGVLDDLTREALRYSLAERSRMLDEQLDFALTLLREQADLA